MSEVEVEGGVLGLGWGRAGWRREGVVGYWGKAWGGCGGGEV